MNGMFNCAIVLVPTPWGLGEGPKAQISVNFNNKVNSKDFKTKLCVLTNKRYKSYKMGFSSGHLVHAPGVKNLFF